MRPNRTLHRVIADPPPPDSCGSPTKAMKSRGTWRVSATYPMATGACRPRIRTSPRRNRQAIGYHARFDNRHLRPSVSSALSPRAHVGQPDFSIDVRPRASARLADDEARDHPSARAVGILDQPPAFHHPHHLHRQTGAAVDPVDLVIRARPDAHVEHCRADAGPIGCLAFLRARRNGSCGKHQEGKEKSCEHGCRSAIEDEQSTSLRQAPTPNP